MTWKNKGYRISIDVLSEDEEQNASCIMSVVTQQEISAKKFKQIEKILKGE